MANTDHIIRPGCPLSAWALKVAHAEYAFRHGPSFRDIREALDTLGHFDLAAAAGGFLPESVTRLGAYDRINRGVGEAKGRTIELARDLLAEREADLGAWIDCHAPDDDWAPLEADWAA